MTEQRATYLAPNVREPVYMPDRDTPLSPRVRALVVGLRRACLLLADVLGEYADLPKRETGVG